MLLFEVVLPMINQVYQLVAPRQFEVNTMYIFTVTMSLYVLYICQFVLPIKDIILVAVMRMSISEIANVFNS